VFGLKPSCARASSYYGDKRGVRHSGVADAAWTKKPGVDGDATPGTYTLIEQLLGLAAVTVAHAASAAFCCTSDADVFLACSNTRRSLRSAIDNLHRMQSSCQRSSVHDSNFTFSIGAFRSFAKGAFGPFFAAALPGGLAPDFLARFLGIASAMTTIGDRCLAGRE
jgi:hypothetical protein